MFLSAQVPPPLVFSDSALSALPSPPVGQVGRSPRHPLVRTYRVRSGDTLSALSKEFGVDVLTLLGANPSVASPAQLAVGSELLVPPGSGVLHTVKAGETLEAIAERYRMEPRALRSANRAVLARELAPGAMLFLPGVAPAVRAVATWYAPQLPTLSGYFIVPTFGRNWGRLHGNNGVDIANVCGTPVVAAAGGVVVQAKDSGWNGGAGRYVVIQHPNGTQTMYGHLQELFVGMGKLVSQSVAIGLIGNTGLTRGITGCHLHFEVRGARNPLVRR